MACVGRRPADACSWLSSTISVSPGGDSARIDERTERFISRDPSPSIAATGLYPANARPIPIAAASPMESSR